MIRFLSFISVLYFSIFSTVEAADIAQRKILGFSPDGRYFAFEQYGIQDGSGFPYAEIFVIKTAANSWLKGTPIRVRIDSEEASLFVARSRALQKARPILKKLRISDSGRILASNPMTEIGSDPHKIVFRPYATIPVFGPRYELSLSEFKMKAVQCQNLTGGVASGFALYLRKISAENTPPRLVLRDTQDHGIPKSRGCPLAYGIADVIRFDPDGYARKNHSTVMIVLLYVYSFGFEGRDGRFIAVSTTGIVE